MIALLTLIVGVVSFLALCLSLTRHQRDLLGRDLPRRIIQAMRIGGYGGIVLAYLIQAIAHGPAYGAVVWAGLLTISAVLVVAVLTLRARRQARSR
ncbi:DUF3325 domain-containing protein [Caulobacter sp. FWC2]|uniref:DUF3325 domain-containing protein n=1 Tax=Caulobacter sp. FWC2 TaxID=69664 RepID=UPI000C161E4F|nr:DUF3325 domain-containing protein [Caulobacter sp. FWC2]PIB91580.1 hypothetical protein CSW62_08335 [Caulobacter sp. FWC2]